MRNDLNLFGVKRIDFNEQIKLTCESVNTYGQFHDHWAVAWSMGKDSTTLLTLLIQLIETGQIMKPKSLTVLRADTRMELPPLWIASEQIIEKLKSRGIQVRTVMAPLDQRFMTYILGFGVPPPSNTFRWCTGMIKIKPMEVALQDLYNETGEKILMLTGVRQGESAIRDGKIHMSCAKGDAECGQGWYQTGLDSDLCSTLAPLLHWRVCSVWDWLKIFAPSKVYGEWPTAILADAYGGEEAEEIAARTGCIGCPLVEKEKSLTEVLKIGQWKFLSPLQELKPIYREMRLPKFRHRKSGGELKKDGTLGKNQQRMGPLTLEARLYFLDKILDIQNRINAGSQTEKLFLINYEEETRIRELIANKTHAVNHPETKHYQADIRTQNIKELEQVDILWASLECTQHSKAKGGKDKDEGSFTLGWELPRYLVHCNPLYLYIENVPEFIRWGELKNGKRVKDKEGLEYLKWVKAIKDLGYVNYERRFLNAADYGCPTRRIRYFGIFSKEGYPVVWPRPTHAEKENIFGLPKWLPCKDYIDLSNEGNSIFGRGLNENILKAKRQPLSENTLRRIAGGVKKFAPELYFIMKYYGNGDNCHSVKEPLHTIRTHESHALIKCEKLQFIQDHCHVASYNLPDEPLRPQLTRQTKQLITIDHQMVMDDNYNRDNVCNSIDKPLNTVVSGGSKRLICTKVQFLAKYYSSEPGRNQHHCQSIDQPFPTIKTHDGTALVTSKAQFISAQYNSNGNPEANNQSIENPLGLPTTKEKFQFITTYFNSGGNPGSQNQSINKPLGTILTEPNKKALVTAVQKDLVDFDIKMRFLTEDELASIMGFPEGYFKKPGLKLSKKDIIKMVGNAVPTGMAKALLEAISGHLQSELLMSKAG